ncbi:MAG TPA: hypothetical protein VHW09_14890 [Bryobacteraceae bacterium]|jgi:hypothetical protein|nr:hypothetical protein [Bryobacteraceae bacterium]
MANTVSMIGIEPGELAWVRTVLSLLRHPDPLIPEMTRLSLVYLQRNASDGTLSAPIQSAGK